MTELARALDFGLYLHLLLAALLGGAIGWERELAGKPAGLRTNVLICVGASLFTELSILLADASGDRGRIAAQIVTGVGFLGAGTILHQRGTVTGLTSAATIWLVAAIGMAVGAGRFFQAIGATVLVILVLAALRRLEQFIDRRSRTSRCAVEVEPGPMAVDRVEQVVKQAGVSFEEVHTEMRDDRLVVEFTMRGPQATQDKAKLALLRSTGAFAVSVEK